MELELEEVIGGPFYLRDRVGRVAGSGAASTIGGLRARSASAICYLISIAEELVGIGAYKM